MQIKFEKIYTNKKFYAIIAIEVEMEKDKNYLIELNSVLMEFAKKFKDLQEKKKSISDEEFKKLDADLAMEIQKTTSEIKRKHAVKN